MLLSHLLCFLAAGASGVRALAPHYTSSRAVDNTIEFRNTNLEYTDIAPRSLEDDDKNYKYTFKELQPQPDGRGFNEQPYYRILLLFKKRPDVTEEFFHKHWKTVHADLTMAGKNIGVWVSRYVQFHAESSYRKQLNPLIKLSQGLIRTAAYDGIAEFHAKSYETFYTFISSVLSDPAQNGDMPKFVDVSAGIEVMAGYDNLMFGSAIKSSGGKDGIMMNDARLSYDIDKGEDGHGKGKGQGNGGKPGKGR